MLSDQTNHTKAQALAQLRKQIQSLEGFKSGEPQAIVRLGIAEIDGALPGGALPLGAIHELVSDGPETVAATTGFLSVLLAPLSAKSGTKPGIVIWITRTGTLYAPGLLPYGLRPENIIFARAADDRDALWAMEEALRCESPAAVVGEIGDPDLTATRRLQLAAESSGVTGFLLRNRPQKNRNSACVTRWQVSPAPGGSWQVELLRVRGGQPGCWQMAFGESEPGLAVIPAQAGLPSPMRTGDGR